eukprot:gene12518-16790_t
MSLPIWDECSWIKEKIATSKSKQKQLNNFQNSSNSTLTKTTSKPKVVFDLKDDEPEKPFVDLKRYEDLFDISVKPSGPSLFDTVSSPSLFDTVVESKVDPPPEIDGITSINISPNPPILNVISSEDIPEPISLEDVSTAAVIEEKPFSFVVNHDINRKMYLHCGEIYKLPADAIIIGQNENLTEKHDGNDAIFTLAGPEMDEELARLAPIQTGDSTITPGYALPSPWVIHAVGPKFDPRYLTASDHALYSAYHTALRLAVAQNVKVLIISCIYTRRKKYPRFDAAHVALRTLRKFLDQPAGEIFEQVMFCVPTQDDYEIYSALMTAYFPRNEDEVDNQQSLLPKELGNEWGEIVLPDRQLKVTVGPKPLLNVEKSRATSTEERSPFVRSSITSQMDYYDLPPDIPKPRSMIDPGEDFDEQRRRKVQSDLEKLTPEEKQQLYYKSL